jgi:hypothetical protein
MQEDDNNNAASVATLQSLPGWQILVTLLNEGKMKSVLIS